MLSFPRLIQQPAAWCIMSVASLAVMSSASPLSYSEHQSAAPARNLPFDAVAQVDTQFPSLPTSAVVHPPRWVAPTPAAKPEPQPAPPAAPVVLADGPLGIPAIAWDSYKKAADRLTAEQPGCGMDWMLLAGIGQVESAHAGGKLRADGYTITPILGPILDGTLEGSAIITDTDQGVFDGDTTFDRAVGPHQFIPSTWALMGKDNSGDGKADPNNIYDSAYSAAHYLCSSGGNMTNPQARTTAILAYNNSLAYVAHVNAWAQGYSSGLFPDLAALPEIHPAPKDSEAEELEERERLEQEAELELLEQERLEQQRLEQERLEQQQQAERERLLAVEAAQRAEHQQGAHADQQQAEAVAPPAAAPPVFQLPPLPVLPCMPPLCHPHP